MSPDGDKKKESVMNQKSVVVTSRLLAIGAVALLLSVPSAGFAKAVAKGPATKGTTVRVELTESEKATLGFMREEEKVARDAYLYLFGVWGDKAFSNIAKSEQTHMDALSKLLVKYGIPDPVANLGVGQFSTPEFQEMYNELIKMGSVSLIEETDIADLAVALSETKVKDLTTVYTNLLRGSQKHLAAFTYYLTLQDIEQ
jgi:hypothetical protein